jgi:flavin reductase (DIM6/NTAB) family NADH-FMN oxidoreductase RutF
VDKFSRCAWHPGPQDTPVLDECENWFAGRILERIPAGDHCAFLLDPFEAHSGTGERPFTFHRARRIEPGHEA